MLSKKWFQTLLNAMSTVKMPVRNVDILSVVPLNVYVTQNFAIKKNKILVIIRSIIS